ncbi:MAG: redoxin domain-containing protein [Balneolaceae bacterium]
MPLKAQDKAPDFSLQNSNGEEIVLSEQLAEGSVVLLFFPLAFTSVCTDEMCTVRDNMKLYESLNTQVFGISVDSFFTLKEFKKAHNINFTLLSDFNREVTDTYGTLYEDFFGMNGVSKRAAFVINREGTILYEEILEDAGNLPDFKAIQQALRKG